MWVAPTASSCRNTQFVSSIFRWLTPREAGRSATENSQIVWLTDSPLAWVSELDDATIWDDRGLAESQMEKASQLITGVEKQLLNVVTINWYEGC